MALLLEIATPDEKVYSESVDSVVLPTTQGELGILPGHIPLMTVIDPGELTVTRNGATEYLAIDKGFIQVHGDKVSVLTEQAINVEAIDTASLDAARARAEKELAEAREKGEDPEILEQLETQANFAALQKLISEKRR